MLVSLAGTYRANPSYWLDPRNGVVYSIIVQTPQYLLNTPEALLTTPIRDPGQTTPQLLGNFATVEHTTTDIVNSHYNIMPVFDVIVNVQDKDLGSVMSAVNSAIASEQGSLPHGSTIVTHGQVQSMAETFTGLGLGIAGALVLVYLLLVVNFQSWVDPIVVLTGAPGVFSGILWMLFITRTTFSVPSLTGTIMTIGVSAANSVLVVSFANQLRAEGHSAMRAALLAGYTRLRPVLMTALAMIVGMLPMALSLGEGSEQNAPLGRAVIGGLLTGTVSTLFIVPIAYSVMRRKQQPRRADSPETRSAQPKPEAVA
jgi:multidrug efflux pump subunit AcrB